jgi:hypothetical protein
VTDGTTPITGTKNFTGIDDSAFWDIDLVYQQDFPTASDANNQNARTMFFDEVEGKFFLVRDENINTPRWVVGALGNFDNDPFIEVAYQNLEDDTIAFLDPRRRLTDPLRWTRPEDPNNPGSILSVPGFSLQTGADLNKQRRY